jgi:hypothetical protein
MELKPRKEAGTIALYCVGMFLGLCLVVLSILNISNEHSNWLLSVSSMILGVLVVFMVGSNLFVIKYTCNEEEGSITIQTGRSKETFKFKEVSKIEEVKTFFPQGTLAKKKVKIDFNRHLERDNNIHTVYMAVEDQKEFIRFLRNHCHAAKYISEEMSKRKITKTTRYK